MGEREDIRMAQRIVCIHRKLWFAFVYNGLKCHSFLTLGPHQNEFKLLSINLKNCKEAGRASEMHSVSMRPVVEASELVGKQQT